MTYESRRTFAIISHPDAGKTTLTERLLVAGGAIHLAGDVKARGNRRRAQSDWMKIEQERGISVTSSVMTFEHDGIVYNLLDTPGHEDFSEDTYRTLTAVDSAIMVIDAAKGIESQTLKLFEVCRLRDIPIIIMVNKVDREGIDPFGLLDDVATTLQLDLSPHMWPVGMGSDFYGIYDLQKNQFHTSSQARGAACDTIIECNDINDSKLDELVPEHILGNAREELELAADGYAGFDREQFRAGNLAPVIFGSALRDYGVKRLIEVIGDHAPEPQPRPADTRIVNPDEKPVTGFVFKMQANMDKNHRDRVAFVRLCSGHFKRSMKLHQVRTGKDHIIHSPMLFLAQDREVADDAFAGDVIGIPNHGTMQVGDTFTEGEKLRFTGLPAFAPEILRRVTLGDMTRVKQLRAALKDLSEEGLIQAFKPSLGSHWIIGVIGILQLDVLKDRAKQEYRIDLNFEGVPYEAARWLKSDDPKKLEEFIKRNTSSIVTDRDESPVFMAKSTWEANYVVERNPDISFLKTKELE
ncbi:Peptide chain release factor 3 [hydrothermal vent metagenome]|uniref:Peptide chain release factor 3 n=1 Tax=hydrothermal vent metagenome TaxID=652676 RepID=A0A3B0RWR0_9ZZZZ